MAPWAMARASSSSPRTRTGAPPARTAEMPSPWASARSPAKPGLPGAAAPPLIVKRATTVPALLVKRWLPLTAMGRPEAPGVSDCARSDHSETMSCQRVAEPIEGRASEPSGKSTKTVAAADAGTAPPPEDRPARSRWSPPPERCSAGGGSDWRVRRSWRSARSSRASLMRRFTGANGSMRKPGSSTRGVETCRSASWSSALAIFFTSTATTCPFSRMRYTRGSEPARSPADPPAARPCARSRSTADSMSRETVSSFSTAN